MKENDLPECFIFENVAIHLKNSQKRSESEPHVMDLYLLYLIIN